MNTEQNECVYDKELEDNNIDIDYYHSEYYDEEISKEYERVECAFCTREVPRIELEVIDGRPCCLECFLSATGFLDELEDLCKDNDDWHDEHSDDKKYDDEKEQYIYKRFMEFTKKTRLGHNIYEQPVPKGYIKE